MVAKSCSIEELGVKLRERGVCEDGRLRYLPNWELPYPHSDSDQEP